MHGPRVEATQDIWPWRRLLGGDGTPFVLHCQSAVQPLEYFHHRPGIARPRLVGKQLQGAPAVFHRVVPSNPAPVRKLGGKASVRNWETWASRYNWRERGLVSDSDLASRRRERMEKELDRAKDDAAVLIRATLAKVAERIQGMDVEDLAVGQIPAALRTLIELELKVLGYEDRVALTGKDGGPVKTEITGKDGGPVKAQHVFQPSKEVWDDVLRKRAEFEKLRDGNTDEDAVQRPTPVS